jgi:two-component system, cell cycle response regulator
MGERILVVDDEESNRDLLEAILAADGYQITLAADGPTALALAAESPPDLILLDLMMPGMSGLQTCQRLKQEPATAGVPVIMVTALGQIANKEAAITCGADDFVTKPVSPDDLRARVRAMLTVRPIARELDRTLAYLHELEAARHAEQHEAPTPVIPEAPPQPATGVVPIPILVVDDDVVTRTLYGDLLVEHGFQVFAAATGKEGLDLLRRQPVEAALLDIMMPGMSGLELLERLHAQDADLPVIMLTAHASSQNAIGALKLGAFDFIVKGLDHDLVVLAVHRAVRHRRDTLNSKRYLDRLRNQIAELQARNPL